MLIETYSNLRDKCDLEYHKPPTNLAFFVREFKEIQWRNSRSRNFFTIIKVLAENGYCTINQIKDRDDLSQTLENRKKRHDVYHRLINGDFGKFDGLIDKLLVEVEDEKNLKTKRNNRYRLTLFGMLYAIHLFSEESGDDIVVEKYHEYLEVTDLSKKKILDVLVENYSDKLPLIFKKWDFMVSEFGTLVNFLIRFAHFTKKFGEMLHAETSLNTDPIHMKGWKSTDLSPSAELSVLFFAWIARQDTDYAIKLAKDQKILDLYKRYLKFLKKKQHFESLRIKYQEAILYGKHDKAKKIGDELEKQ